MGNKKAINEEQYIDLWNDNKTHREISNVFGIGLRTSQSYAGKLKSEGKIEDRMVDVTVKLAKEKQKLQDQNRISNKAFREYARIDNAVAELQENLLTLLKEKSLPKSIFKGKKIPKNKKVGAIVHLTDLHFNELINLMHNKYDFNIASQRLRKFVNDTKLYLKAHNVKDICVAMTGDLLNSDRRLDELLSEATNRAKAVILSVTLLEQVLLDLQSDFNVSVAHVIGNESRITKDVGWVEEVASDNYDTIIHGVLTKIFEKSNIKFFQGSSTEKVIEIIGQNVLLIHGNQLKSTNAHKQIQQIKGKYASQGVLISFVISGHYHNAKIGDTYSQGSSLAGANAYSNDALQLESRASQNIHIFFDNGNRDSIKVDLQNVEGIEGYPIEKDLIAYNAKSVSKSKKKVTVHKIVI